MGVQTVHKSILFYANFIQIAAIITESDTLLAVAPVFWTECERRSSENPLPSFSDDLSQSETQAKSVTIAVLF
ncbi:hypothetical protein MCC93_24140 [Morococcus cerebrosus]|uniref:Uncharacterized protein n=1 Tax=Morococcus cerebrosus TaxID=1056807 RepID=A0A0C1GHR1_9NEIS|nr:hypothetical protein MCC93_24140 [Morococcus cerebrosus]